MHPKSALARQAGDPTTASCKRCTKHPERRHQTTDPNAKFSFCNLRDALIVKKSRALEISNSKLTLMSRTPDPPASSLLARRRMQLTPSRDTRPELRLRSALHREGLRYRVDVSPVKGLRRRADAVFTRARVAVFLDGCYWHGCPEHCIWPKSNFDWWRDKIRKNQARDEDTNRRLTEEGWLVIRVWEHESAETAAQAIKRLVQARSASHSASKA